MPYNDGLLVWWAVEVVEQLQAQGAKADDVVCQQPPGQRSRQQHGHVGHDSERGKAKVRRKLGVGVGASLLLAGNDFRN